MRKYLAVVPETCRTLTRVPLVRLRAYESSSLRKVCPEFMCPRESSAAPGPGYPRLGLVPPWGVLTTGVSNHWGRVTKWSFLPVRYWLVGRHADQPPWLLRGYTIQYTTRVRSGSSCKAVPMLHLQSFYEHTPRFE